MKSIRALVSLALLLAGGSTATPLVAQDFPPLDWTQAIYYGPITKYQRYPYERPRFDLPILRPAPPTFRFYAPFAGVPGKAPEMDSEFSFSSDPCLIRPKFITHNGHGVVLVCQENAHMKLLDGASAIDTFNWGGVNGNVPVETPVASVAPVKTCMEWVQTIGGFDVIRGDINGIYVPWWTRNPVSLTPINGLSVDVQQRVWATNPDGVSYFDASTGAATVLVPAGSVTPTQSRFIPTAVACDASADLNYVATATAIYLVDSVKGTLTTVAGDPDVAGFTDGSLTMSRFSRITGMAVHDSGWVLVIDDGNLRWVDPNGLVSTQPKLPAYGGFNLNSVFQVTFDRDTALLTDPDNHVVWRVF